MTESSPAITLLEPKDEAHNGSVGPLVPDMESKIIGQNGEELGIGEEGELVRLRQSTLFRGGAHQFVFFLRCAY